MLFGYFFNIFITFKFLNNKVQFIFSLTGNLLYSSGLNLFSSSIFFLIKLIAFEFADKLFQIISFGYFFKIFIAFGF